MNWLERNTPARVHWASECRLYLISADKPSEGHEPWWDAKTASGKPIASGYGDDGLAKCKRYAEQHRDRDAQPSDRVAPIEISLPKSFVCEPAVKVEPQQSLL
jgi:hypothetical protein